MESQSVRLLIRYIGEDADKFELGAAYIIGVSEVKTRIIKTTLAGRSISSNARSNCLWEGRGILRRLVWYTTADLLKNTNSVKLSWWGLKDGALDCITYSSVGNLFSVLVEFHNGEVYDGERGDMPL